MGSPRVIDPSGTTSPRMKGGPAVVPVTVTVPPGVADGNMDRAPVVVITGFPTIESAKEAVRLGANNYIAKPVGPEEVIKAASDAINQKRWALRSETPVIH